MNVMAELMESGELHDMLDEIIVTYSRLALKSEECDQGRVAEHLYFLREIQLSDTHHYPHP